MKHKTSPGLLRRTLLLVVMLMASTGLWAWKVDVMVNSSTEGPTMSFGEEAASIMAPMPPFSGMYGVVDVYLAANNVYATNVPADPGIRSYYNRLSVDVKTTATGNRWVLVAGSNARLTWSVADGAIPANFYIAWLDGTVAKRTAVVAGETFSVKLGVTYTLGVNAGATATDLKKDDNNPTQLVAKDDDGNLTPAVITITAPSMAGVTSYTVSINLNAGTTLLAYPVWQTGVIVKYMVNNGTEILPNALADAAVWVVDVVAPGYDVALAWDTTDPNILIATMTANGTRADDDWLITAQASKTGLAALDANATLTRAGSDTPNTLLGNLIAIIQQLGTLDFDGNGVVNLDDATYLYNYAAGGMDPYATAADIMAFTTAGATVASAQAALDFFRDNLSELYFDGTDEQVGVLLDNATYFYNFASGNFDEYATGADLKAFSTAAATDALAEEALATMREFLDNAR